MRYALIDNQRAVTIENFDNIATALHPDIVALYVEAPVGVEVGHYYIGGVWVGPKPSKYHSFVGGVWVEDTAQKTADQLLAAEFVTLIAAKDAVKQKVKDKAKLTDAEIASLFDLILLKLGL